MIKNVLYYAEPINGKYLLEVNTKELLEFNSKEEQVIRYQELLSDINKGRE